MLLCGNKLMNLWDLGAQDGDTPVTDGVSRVTQMGNDWADFKQNRA